MTDPICLACSLSRHVQCPGCPCDHTPTDPALRASRSLAVLTADLRDLLCDSVYDKLLDPIETIRLAIPGALAGRAVDPDDLRMEW